MTTAEDRSKVERVLAALARGPLHRFSEFASATHVPTTGAGVYTIWDDDGRLVYVGVAGRNPNGKGLSGRLRSHASGRRSGDQFCVYVSDHYVLPTLTGEQIMQVAESRLSMDGLVRKFIHERFSFRVGDAPDYVTALAAEREVKAGALPMGPPLLNPAASAR